MKTNIHGRDGPVAYFNRPFTSVHTECVPKSSISTQASFTNFSIKKLLQKQMDHPRIDGFGISQIPKTLQIIAVLTNS